LGLCSFSLFYLKPVINVNHGKLPQAPWFVFQEIHARNSCPWQLTGREAAVDACHIQHADVATGRRLKWHNIFVREKVQFDRAARQYGVLAIGFVSITLKA